MAFPFVGSALLTRGSRRQRHRQTEQQRAAGRLVFEALEPRVLLSADPLTIALSGDAAHPMAHDVIVESVTQQPNNLNPNTVQMVQIVDEAQNNTVLASTPLSSVDGIQITGGTGNTSVTVNATSFGGATIPQITFNGGDGNNSLIVTATTETDWTVTGANTGTVDGSVPIVFTGVNNLAGGGQNANVFTVNPGGSLNGTLDGGPGVNGTLLFNNYSATNAVYTASGPHSGTVALDGSVFTYADLSPIIYSGTAANVTINGTGELTLGDTGTPGQIEAASLNNSMESVTFSAPTNSLTVNLTSGSDSLAIGTLHTAGASLTADGSGTDSIAIDAGATVSTRMATSDALTATSLGNSGNLYLSAATVTIGDGAIVYANANSGFTAGAITLDAASTGTATQAGSSSVLVDNAQVAGGSIGIDAVASAGATVSQHTQATLDLSVEASALIEGASTVTATTGSVDIDASVGVDGQVTADALAGGATDADAADALAYVYSSATAGAIGPSMIDAADNVSVQSTNLTSVTTLADGSTGGSSALGGTAAVSDVTTSSTALLGPGEVESGSSYGLTYQSTQYSSGSGPQVTAAQVSVTATSDVGVTTTAIATRGGATEDSAEGQAALEGQVGTAEGPMTLAGAVAGTNLNDSTSAISAASVTTTGNFDVTGYASRDVTTIANASGVGGPGSNSASALNTISVGTTAQQNGTAVVGGDATISVGHSVGPNSFEAEALSASSDEDVGAAVATNDLTDNANAEAGGGQITADALTVSADQADTIDAIAALGGVPSSVSDGAIVSTNNVEAEAAASVVGGSIATGTGELSVDGTSGNVIESQAGAVGSFGAGGLLGTDAYNNVDNQTGTTAGVIAQVDDSTVTAGSVSIQAQDNDQITADAVGASGAQSDAADASVAYNTADPQVSAEAGSDSITLTGALTINASNYGSVTAGAGSVEGPGDAAGGGAVAVNHVTNAIDATLDGGSVTAASAGLTALNDAVIKALAAVGDGAGTADSSTPIAINTVGGVVEAEITGAATVTTGGAVSVTATDDGTIHALAGGASGAASVHGGTAIALNRIGNIADESSPDISGMLEQILGNPANDPAAEPPLAGTTASIDSGSAVTGGAVSVMASFTDGIEAAAIAGTAGGTITQAGALTDNLVGDQVTATIAGAATSGGSVVSGSKYGDQVTKGPTIPATNVQATGSQGGSVTISATNTATTQSLAGTQNSDNPAGGAAAAVNKLDGSANATVDGATVSTLTGDISLNATGGAAITAASVAGFILLPVDLSAATTVNDLGNTIDAEAEDGATLDAAGNVELISDDSGPVISNANGDAAPGGVSLNGADATNTIADQVSTRADNSSLIAANGEIELATTDTVAAHALASATTGGTTDMSAAVTTNVIGNVLKAVINDSVTPAGTSVFVQASFNGTVESNASQGQGGLTSSGGAGAYNQVENTVAAAIEGGANVSATDGDVMVQADDAATVSTLAAGGGEALGLATGGSVSVSIVANNVYADVSNSTVAAYGNLGVIADDTDNLTASGGQTNGGVIGAAASAAALTLNSQTEAYIDGSSVSALGTTSPLLAVTINPSTGAATATSASGVAVVARDIEAVNVSALTVAGGEAAIPASVANIATGVTTEAYITGSDVNNANGPGSGVLVHASQSTNVNGNIGTTSGGLAAIGAEVQISNIDNTTEAYIANDLAHGEVPAVMSDVYADTITVLTTTYEQVSVTTNGVAGGLAAVSGTVAYTDIASTSNAYVTDSLLDARNGAATITVSAVDNASITTNDSNSEFGLLGAGAAVDVSTIADNTAATLNGAQLNANGAIVVIADSTGAINDTATGGAGGLLALAGSILIDHINTATEASTQSDGSLATLINQDSTFRGESLDGHDNTQSVTVQAAGNASIDGWVGASAFGLLGAGASIQVGGIDDQVSATVGAGSVINAGGDITVTATDVRNLQSTSFANIGGALALSGAFSILSIGGSFESGSLAAVNKADSNNGNDLTSTTNQMVDEAPISDMISAHDSVVAKTWQDDDVPPAPQVADPLANSTAVSGTFATVGSSGPGAAPRLTAGEDIAVSATNKFDVNASAGANAGGLVSLGIGVAYTDVTDTVTAQTGDGAVLSAGGGITVAANDSTSKQTQVSATTGNGGLVAIGGALTHTTLNLAVTAVMAPSTTVTSAGAVTVTAAQEANLQTTGNNGAGGFIAAGDVQANTTIDGFVSAAVGNGVQLGANDAIGSLTIDTSANDTGGANSTAGSGGGIAVDSSSAITNVTPQLSAILGNDAVANVTGNVAITSASSGDAYAEADGTEVGLGAIGVSDASATFAPSGAAVIGEQAFVGAGGNVVVEATDATTGSVTATADSSTGGFIAGSGATSTATDNGSASAAVNDGATLEAGGTVSIWSTIVNYAQGNANTKDVGFVTVGSQTAASYADGTSTAELESDTTVVAYALQVEAAGSGTANATANAAAGGIASGLGSNATVDASPNVTAEILDGAQVSVGANVDVIAVGIANTDAQANGTDGAAFGEIGTSNTTVTGTPSVDAAIGHNSVVNAGGNVTVEAVSPETGAVSSGDFNALTGVNLSNNSITFSAPTYLQTGDQVTYETNGHTAIGGLQNGRTYSVIDTSATGFSLGQEFSAAQVNAATSTIQFAAPDGFQTGDKVVYSADGGTPIGGLVDGATYYVRVINATTIKLATSFAEAESTGAAFTTAQIGAGGLITWRSYSFTNGEAVTYRSTGASIAGLVNGDTYFVIRVNNDAFELSAEPNGPALVLGQGSVSGVQTLGAEGVALDGTGIAGFQSLTFDLTSYGSGTQRFVGVGGAAAILPTVQATPYYGANATGSGGAAFVGDEGMTSSVTITGSVTAYVGVNANVQGGDDVTVEANSYRDSVDSASNEVGGLGAVGGAYGTTDDTETTTAQLADGASLTAGLDASVTANGEISASGESSSDGGGGVAINQANTTITLVPVTSVQLGSNAAVAAQQDVAVTANQTLSGAIDDTAGDGGLGASSHADGVFEVGWPVALPVAVQVDDGVDLTAGRDVSVTATYALPDIRIDNSASSSGLYAHPTTNAFIQVDTPSEVILSSGDQLTAVNRVNLSATYGTIGLDAFPTTYKTGIGGQDPVALVQAGVVASIIVPYGVDITAHGLVVTATTGVPNVKAEAVEGNSPQFDADTVTISPQRDITFDGNVILTSGPAPELVVNRFGQVVDDVGVTYSIAGGTITVNAIDDANPGYAHFVTSAGITIQFPFSLTPFVQSVIAGTQADFTFVDTFPTVTLANWSAMNMVVNTIDPVIAAPSAAINIIADKTSGFKFTVANVFQPTAITIGNYALGTVANLTVAGDIEDPIGSIALTAASGNIVAKNSNALIQGASVSLTAAGNIGAAALLLPVEVIDSPQAVMGLNATAGGNLDLSVQARLRDPSVSSFNPQLGSLIAGGNINLDLLPAVRDSIVLGPTYTVAVTRSGPDFGIPTTTDVVTGWPNNAGPAAALPSGIFAVGSTPISATYRFALLQAGGGITVTNPGAGSVGLIANTVLLNPGNAINVSVSGTIALTETSGDLRVGTIDSTGGSVSLTALTGSILDQSTGPAVPPPAIEGTNITLTADEGNIGTLNNALDIELLQGTGALTALSRNGIDILDVAGALTLHSVDAGGAIILGAANGGISAASGAALPEVVGQTISLSATLGIGTAADPLQVQATAPNGVKATSTRQAYVTQETDAVLLEAGLSWSLGDGGTAAGLVNWEMQV